MSWCFDMAEPPKSDDRLNVHVLKLESGGELRFRADVDMFSISDEDRNFLFGIIAQVQAYERNVNARRETAAAPE